MLKTKNSTQFKRDLKKFKYQQKMLMDLNEVLKMICNQIPLPEKYRDHNLTGEWIGHRECHIKPDVLLIYKINGSILFLERIGSHSELFR